WPERLYQSSAFSAVITEAVKIELELDDWIGADIDLQSSAGSNTGVGNESLQFLPVAPALFVRLVIWFELRGSGSFFHFGQQPVSRSGLPIFSGDRVVVLRGIG